MSRRNLIAWIAIIGALTLLESACALVTQTLETGGEKQFKPAPPPPPPTATHVLVFAMDGATPAQFMEAVHSGHAPYIAALLGKDEKVTAFLSMPTRRRMR